MSSSFENYDFHISKSLLLNGPLKKMRMMRYQRNSRTQTWESLSVLWIGQVPKNTLAPAPNLLLNHTVSISHSAQTSLELNVKYHAGSNNNKKEK